MSEVGKTIALIRALGTPTDAQVTSAVEGWLDDHPEATTTVTDGSITNAKLASSFVTPGTASAYSSSATYAVGDYVFYGGALYRCTTAITTAEAWTAAHWTAAVLGDDVSDVSADTKTLISAVGIYKAPTAKGTLPATSGLHTILSPITITNGHSYTMSITLEEASDIISYYYVVASDGTTTIASKNINVGDTSATKDFTANVTDANAFIAVNANARALKYTVVLTDNTADTRNNVVKLQAAASSLIDFTGETNPLTFAENKYISTPSIGGQKTDFTPENLNGCVCLSASCTKGDIFTITGTPRDNSGSRAIAVFNSDGYCMYRLDDTAALNNYKFVTQWTGTIVINLLKANTHEAYKGIRGLEGYIIQNMNDIDDIVNAPLETLPSYIMNDLAYRPLGQLQHPYLCLSCDDGSAELETYTIPMLLQKNVPCTFGLWASQSVIGETPVFSKSVVLRTQSGVDAVLSAIANGCTVAQHGTVEWTELSERELNGFFDREKEAFDDLGITVKGAICPSHCINNKVRAIAGGRFHSVRSGYSGYLSKEDQQNHVAGDIVGYYGVLTGARSNCYGYTSFNVNDKTLAELKTILDNAISNNLCMIIYWHDWDLTTAQKETLEAFIDYAKTTTVTFVTLDQIPRLK